MSGAARPAPLDPTVAGAPVLAIKVKLARKQARAIQNKRFFMKPGNYKIECDQEGEMKIFSYNIIPSSETTTPPNGYSFIGMYPTSCFPGGLIVPGRSQIHPSKTAIFIDSDEEIPPPDEGVKVSRNKLNFSLYYANDIQYKFLTDVYTLNVIVFKLATDQQVFVYVQTPYGYQDQYSLDSVFVYKIYYNPLVRLDSKFYEIFGTSSGEMLLLSIVKNLLQLRYDRGDLFHVITPKYKVTKNNKKQFINILRKSVENIKIQLEAINFIRQCIIKDTEGSTDLDSLKDMDEETLAKFLTSISNDNYYIDYVTSGTSAYKNVNSDSEMRDTEQDNDREQGKEKDIEDRIEIEQEVQLDQTSNNMLVNDINSNNNTRNYHNIDENICNNSNNSIKSGIDKYSNKNELDTETLSEGNQRSAPSVPVTSDEAIDNKSVQPTSIRQQSTVRSAMSTKDHFDKVSKTALNKLVNNMIQTMEERLYISPQTREYSGRKFKGIVKDLLGELRDEERFTESVNNHLRSVSHVEYSYVSKGMDKTLLPIFLRYVPNVHEILFGATSLEIRGTWKDNGNLGIKVKKKKAKSESFTRKHLSVSSSQTIEEDAFQPTVVLPVHKIREDIDSDCGSMEKILDTGLSVMDIESHTMLLESSGKKPPDISISDNTTITNNNSNTINNNDNNDNNHINNTFSININNNNNNNNISTITDRVNHDNIDMNMDMAINGNYYVVNNYRGSINRNITTERQIPQRSATYNKFVSMDEANTLSTRIGNVSSTQNVDTKNNRADVLSGQISTIATDNMSGLENIGASSTWCSEFFVSDPININIPIQTDFSTNRKMINTNNITSSINTNTIVNSATNTIDINNDYSTAHITNTDTNTINTTATTTILTENRNNNTVFIDNNTNNDSSFLDSDIFNNNNNSNNNNTNNNNNSINTSSTIEGRDDILLMMNHREETNDIIVTYNDNDDSRNSYLQHIREHSSNPLNDSDNFTIFNKKSNNNSVNVKDSNDSSSSRDNVNSNPEEAKFISKRPPDINENEK